MIHIVAIKAWQEMATNTIATIATANVAIAFNQRLYTCKCLAFLTVDCNSNNYNNSDSTKKTFKSLSNGCKCFQQLPTGQHICYACQRMCCRLSYHYRCCCCCYCCRLGGKSKHAYNGISVYNSIYIYTYIYIWYIWSTL